MSPGCRALGRPSWSRSGACRSGQGTENMPRGQDRPCRQQKEPCSERHASFMQKEPERGVSIMHGVILASSRHRARWGPARIPALPGRTRFLPAPSSASLYRRQQRNIRARRQPRPSGKDSSTSRWRYRHWQPVLSQGDHILNGPGLHLRCIAFAARCAAHAALGNARLILSHREEFLPPESLTTSAAFRRSPGQILTWPDPVQLLRLERIVACAAMAATQRGAPKPRKHSSRCHFATGLLVQSLSPLLQINRKQLKGTNMG